MLLGVVLMGASAAASTPTATAEEVSLIAAIGRVPLADMLRDHVAEFTSAHTPHRVIRPPDTASGNAVLEADVTGLRLVSGMLTVAVRSRLRWPTWSVPFYEATLVYVSPHSLPAWAENEGEALRVELDGVTRALAERIVEEAFLRYVP
jgi:hypothetical protein